MVTNTPIGKYYIQYNKRPDINSQKEKHNMTSMRPLTIQKDVPEEVKNVYIVEAYGVTSFEKDKSIIYIEPIIETRLDKWKNFYEPFENINNNIKPVDNTKGEWFIRLIDEPLVKTYSLNKNQPKAERDNLLHIRKTNLTNKLRSVKQALRDAKPSIKILGEYYKLVTGIFVSEDSINSSDIEYLTDSHPDILRISYHPHSETLIDFAVPGTTNTKIVHDLLVDANNNPIDGTGIKIGVLDTGIDYNHPDLIDAYKGGWNSWDNNDSPMDYYGHGTHCAGIIAGSGISSDGKLRGISPGVDLYAFQVCNNNGSCSQSNIVDGIERALDPDGDFENGMDILSISLGVGDFPLVNPGSVASQNAIDNTDVIIVAAAGNNAGTNQSDKCKHPLYPGGYSHSICAPGNALDVICVGAATKFNNSYHPSSRGPTWELDGVCNEYDSDGSGAYCSDYTPYTSEKYDKPDIAAVGHRVCASRASSDVGSGDCAGDEIDNDLYTEKSGTSMATPMVAGHLALLKQAYPNATRDEIIQYMKDGATVIDDTRTSWPTNEYYMGYYDYGDWSTYGNSSWGNAYGAGRIDSLNALLQGGQFTGGKYPTWVGGCIDAQSLNHNEDAHIDDGSCQKIQWLHNEPGGFNMNDWPGLALDWELEFDEMNDMEYVENMLGEGLTTFKFGNYFGPDAIYPGKLIRIDMVTEWCSGCHGNLTGENDAGIYACEPPYTAPMFLNYWNNITYYCGDSFHNIMMDNTDDFIHFQIIYDLDGSDMTMEDWLNQGSDNKKIPTVNDGLANDPYGWHLFFRPDAGESWQTTMHIFPDGTIERKGYPRAVDNSSDSIERLLGYLNIDCPYGDTECRPELIYGCTNPDMDNYNPEATVESGECRGLGYCYFEGSITENISYDDCEGQWWEGEYPGSVIIVNEFTYNDMNRMVTLEYDHNLGITPNYVGIGACQLDPDSEEWRCYENFSNFPPHNLTPNSDVFPLIYEFELPMEDPNSSGGELPAPFSGDDWKFTVMITADGADMYEEAIYYDCIGCYVEPTVFQVRGARSEIGAFGHDGYHTFSEFPNGDEPGLEGSWLDASQNPTGCSGITWDFAWMNATFCSHMDECDGSYGSPITPEQACNHFFPWRVPQDAVRVEDTDDCDYYQSQNSMMFEAYDCVPAAPPPPGGGSGDPCISPTLLMGEMPETNEYLSARRKKIRGRRRKKK